MRQSSFYRELLWPLSQLRLTLSKLPLPHDISITADCHRQGTQRQRKRLCAGDERKDKRKKLKGLTGMKIKQMGGNWAGKTSERFWGMES